MSDRDRDLTALFVRDIDQIDLPPRAAWRPAPRKEHRAMSVLRPLAYATATSLVLVAALVVGMTLRDRGAPATAPSPSVAPTAVPSATATSDASTASPAATTAPAASPTASASTGVLDERFGFVIIDGDPFNADGTARVRSETSADEISSFPVKRGSFSSVTVSPDGRSVAYWDPAIGTPVLRIQSVTGGTARKVLTGTDGQGGGRKIVWTPDGTGLVASLGPARLGGSSELWTVELTNGATERIATRSDGWVWLPVAWDRGAKLVGAGVTGEGGFVIGYDVISLAEKPYAVRSTPLRDPGEEYRALDLGSSQDARFVWVISNLIREPKSSSSGIVWWPVSAPEKRSKINGDPHSAAWRPGTSEIWWIDGLRPAGCRAAPCRGTELVSFDVATGARTVRFRGDFAPGLVGFRVDGSAAIIASVDFGPPPGGTEARTEITVVELQQGRTEKISESRLGPMVRIR